MIKIEKLSFDYSETKNVIRNIDLTIDDGDQVGIIGPNGAGKTTLFQLLSGLLEPKKGIIQINKKIVEPKRFNHEVGYIFQNPDDMLFNATVYEDVAFGPLNLGLSREKVKSQVEKALRITGCSKLRDRPPHHLSGGEKRMAAIASVLSMKPKVMIYDEPSSNLDMRARRKLISFINSGKETKIIASHDLEFILETCSRVVLLDNGKIMADGDPKKVMNDSKFMEAHGLERPHSLLHGKSHRH